MRELEISGLDEWWLGFGEAVVRELCRLEFGAGAEVGARRLLGDICCSDCGVLKYLELQRLFGEEQPGDNSSALCKGEVCSSRINSVGGQISQNHKLSSVGMVFYVIGVVNNGLWCGSAIGCFLVVIHTLAGAVLSGKQL